MHNLGVVPIFVSAGAAVFPTVVAMAGSVLALLLQPRELAKWIVNRWRTVLVACVIGTATCAIGWASVAHWQRAAAERRGKIVDWARIVEQWETSEATATAPVAITMPSNDKPSEYARANWDGSPAPLGLKTAWSYHPEKTLFLSKPVIRDGKAYVAGAQAEPGAYFGILACIDMGTGHAVWEQSAAGEEFFKGFFSSPTLTDDGKYLLIGQGMHEDRDCALLCVEADTGKARWQVKSNLHIESSPAVKGDLVVVGAGAIETKDGKPNGDPGYVFAVRISDGKPLWRAQVTDPESSPAIGEDGTVYIGSGFNGLAIVALRSESDEDLQSKGLKRELWRTPTEHPIVGDITLAGDLVIAGGGNGNFVNSAATPAGVVVALDRATGKVRWERNLEDAVIGAVAVHSDRAFCGSRTGEVVALNLKDGSVAWRSRISGKAPVLAGPAVTDKVLYAVTNDGFLAVIDLQNGKVLEKVMLNDAGTAGTGLNACPPVVVGGRLLVGTETGGMKLLVGGTK